MQEKVMACWIVIFSALVAAAHVKAQEPSEPPPAAESEPPAAVEAEPEVAVEAEPEVAPASEPSVTAGSDPVVTIETADPEVSITYVEAAPAAEEECEIYCKHVEGKLWIEGTAGPARYNMTKFRSFNVLPDGVGTLVPKVIVSGPEYGAGIGAQFELVSVGGRFKYGKFGDFDLLSAGIDVGFLAKSVPYVHPYGRFGIYYSTTRNGTPIPGLDNLLTGMKINGGNVSIGAGIRVPIIKWISIAAGFDYSFVGLFISGDEPTGERFEQGVVGGAISGTFALTVHPL
jgi:hypothetical protein